MRARLLDRLDDGERLENGNDLEMRRRKRRMMMMMMMMMNQKCFLNRTRYTHTKRGFCSNNRNTK
jgi:hypothetical protein